MWEVLLGYALEKVFGSHTTAFEIGGEYVQTTVPRYDAPQTISKTTLGFDNNNSALAGIGKKSTNLPRVRQRVQVGFNPFTPIIIIGAEELYKHIAPPSERDIYD